MWSAECDICKTTYELYDGCIAINEKSAIIDDIKESEEWIIAKDGKCYCSDCHQTSWNEEEDQNEIYSFDDKHSGAIFLGVQQ